MLELGHRERNLLSGISVQILIVGLLVFAYTQAIRQFKHQRELFGRLQEQLTMAREQMARVAVTPDLAAVQGQIQALQARFLAVDSVEKEVERIKLLAEKELGLHHLQWERKKEPMNWIYVPISGRDDFEVELVGLEMKGQAPSSSVAWLLASMAQPPVLPLTELEMTARSGDADPPVDVSFRWFLPVVASLLEEKKVPPPAPRATVNPVLGGREEPFQSPLDYPNALRVPPERTPFLRLTGILWDPVHPACVINEQVLRPGERVDRWEVVLITEKAVLLVGPTGELLLRQS